MLEMNRREFLKQTGLSTATTFIAFTLPLAPRKAMATGQALTHHYLAIGPNDGEFVFTMDKAEMGQGVITGQVTLFCEEFDLDPKHVKVTAAPVKEVYGTMSGLQITGGSTSTNQRWEVLRQAGADIRGALLEAASKKWNTPISELKTENGFVLKADGSESISYNKLASELKSDQLQKRPLKKESEFKYIGKDFQKVDSEEKSMGTALFGIDFKVEGMLNALVLRSPTFGGKIKSVDSSEALKVPGIKKVVQISSGVAIVGEKYWQVLKARNLVKVEWDKGPNAGLSSEDIQKKYEKMMSEGSGKSIHEVGDLEETFENKSNGEVITAEYELPYLAHATMEPMNAVAHVQKKRVDIWTGTQSPTNVQNEAADFLGFSRDQVFVHNMTYLGGGFGRRSTVDYPMEAIEVSQIVKAPVKLIWSREDDMKFSPMRPINRHHFKGLLQDGKPVAWEHKLGCESLMQSFAPSILPHILPGWLPSFVRGGIAGAMDGALGLFNYHMVTAEGAKLDYDIPHQAVKLFSQGLDIPIHFWRSVGHSYNGFVVESFIDEMAFAAKADPFEFRKVLLKNNPRGLAVTEKVAEMAQWSSPLPEGLFRGIAYQFSFQTYVAEVAEVRVDDSGIKVEKVYCAVDCGTVVNPDIVVDQMKSGIIYGLSAALSGQITLQDGGVAQSNFHDYPVMRMSETPEIEVAIIESKETPTGVGEHGLTPIAAAVGNAVFSATGQRLRKLPLSLT